jgi:methyl-accepting chemotaxis protein
LAGAIERIGAVNGAIAQSAERQESMVGEISRHIERINHVAHETVSSSAQTADSAGSLVGLASQLRGVVNRFRV